MKSDGDDERRKLRNEQLVKNRHWRIALFKAGLVVPDHGKVSTYNNYGCRCDKCKWAKSRRDRGRERRGKVERSVK